MPGGAPYNAAIAAGRLGAPTSFLGVFSDDRFGRMLRSRLVESHVDVKHCPVTHDPTTLALVSQDRAGEPGFTFHVDGTTSTSGRVNDLHLPSDVGVLHVSGSVAMVVEPAASRIAALMAASGHRALLHLDANPRPAVIDREAYLRRLDRWLGRADVVKMSAADAEWIEPGADPIELADSWLRPADPEAVEEHRPLAVVVTMGEQGAAVALPFGVVEVAAPEVEVVDTIGAGDTFTGAVLAAFSAHRVTDRAALAKLDGGWWHTALTYAAEAAAISCSRPGCDPPWRHELT